jgi:hypothetical protein
MIHSANVYASITVKTINMMEETLLRKMRGFDKLFYVFTHYFHDVQFLLLKL